MPWTEWKNPSTSSQITANDVSWTDPDNAHIDDGSYATIDLAAGETSESRRWTGFGFDTDDIPDGSTIVGVEVHFQSDLTNNGGDIGRERINIYDATNGVSTETKISNLSSTFEHRYYGGAGCLWEESSIDEDDVRASTFGVQLEFENVDAGEFNLRLDVVEVRVYYLDNTTGVEDPAPIIESSSKTTDSSDPAFFSAPTGISANDTLLLMSASADITTAGTAQYTWEQYDKDITADGWRNINEVGDDSSIARWKGYIIPDAAGSEGGRELDTTQNTAKVGWYVRVSGCENESPIDAIAFAELSSASTHTLPSITTTRDNCLLVYMIAFDGADGSPVSTPSGYTEQDEDSAGSGTGRDVTAAWGTKTQTNAGSAGGETFTTDVADGSVVVLMALRPPVTAGSNRDVTCTTETLEITGNDAFVEYPLIFTTSTESLEITVPAGDVTPERLVTGTTEVLQLSDSDATAQTDRGVSGATESLVLTDSDSTVQRVREVSGSTESLEIADTDTSIQIDRTVVTNTESLEITFIGVQYHWGNTSASGPFDNSGFNNFWSNESNAFDGNFETYASCSDGNVSNDWNVNSLEGRGTIAFGPVFPLDIVKRRFRLRGFVETTGSASIYVEVEAHDIDPGVRYGPAEVSSSSMSWSDWVDLPDSPDPKDFDFSVYFYSRNASGTFTAAHAAIVQLEANRPSKPIVINRTLGASANTVALEITENVATVTRLIRISGSTEELQLADNDSEINRTRNVNSITEQLQLVDNDTNVFTGRLAAGSTEVLTLSDTDTSVNRTRGVISSSEQLLVTSNNATANRTLNLSTLTEQLLISDNDAVISVLRLIAGSTEGLVITGNDSVINRARTITTLSEVLELIAESGIISFENSDTITQELIFISPGTESYIYIPED